MTQAVSGSNVGQALTGDSCHMRIQMALLMSTVPSTFDCIITHRITNQPYEKPTYASLHIAGLLRFSSSAVCHLGDVLS